MTMDYVAFVFRTPSALHTSLEDKSLRYIHCITEIFSDVYQFLANSYDTWRLQGRMNVRPGDPGLVQNDKLQRLKAQ